MSVQPIKNATRAGRKLGVAILGLASFLTLMLSAFVLPSVNSGPHEIPVGISGPTEVARPLQQNLDGDEWNFSLYGSRDSLTSAIRERRVMGGLMITADSVEIYTASAGGTMAAGAVTALGNTVAASQHKQAAAHDLVAYPKDDPRGAGLSAATLPMVLGGIVPAVLLCRIFPGYRSLRVRLAGVLLISLVAGAAITAVLQFGTGSLAGSYGLSTLGLTLGMAASSFTLIGLEGILGFVGLGLGGALMMLLGNPLTGLASGPHWLPEGWASLGQMLPPGATGSVLRATAFFDGTGASTPALVLAAWAVFGLLLAFITDRRGRSAGGTTTSAESSRLAQPVGNPA
ncbi:hypothetical protein PV664_35725 [Streptomyces sp. ME01-18a]|uniref:hypothetical protein n=1 Tax=Streptomyces sp. ME01-18a TaxID=3028669 RepID=UPI0029BBABCA|nr:hypothetical protein [Streptomyces sp. ME01-18a]MDX3434211.1 hypothetical protein [Streptomyces sp. ME01-18a]